MTAGNGTATETRDLPSFTSVALNGVSTVRIHNGPQAVRVTIDETLADRYDTEVRNGKLMMGFKCGIGTLWALRNLKTCEVDVTMPEMEGIELNGAGTVDVDAFDCDGLTVDVTGTGTVGLKGTASSILVTCTGACKVLASDCAAATGRVKMTGAARVEARVRDTLDASLTGSSTLLYWGDPAVTQRISGAGSVQRAGD